MKVEPRTVILKDGRKCILRNATGADAEGMLKYLRTAGGETEFILRYPDEVDRDFTNELVTLEVVSKNEKALGLYKKMGFKKIGELPMALKLDSGGYYSEVLVCRKKGEKR
ncbi:MAG: hypothetical protein MJ185_06425 [Treponema sp.]|nr:hypothetical protein [Treponema sp.]